MVWENGGGSDDSARYYNPALQRFISEDPVGFSASVNFYSYAQNNPISGNDPLGLWDTYTHSALYWNALKPCGVDNNTIYQIQQRSASLDASTQAPWDAYIHSMKAPFQSAADALNERDHWIESNLKAARARLHEGSPVSVVHWEDLFANAAHTITDSTSPAHMQNGVPITWPSWPNALEHGGEPNSIETWDNMTPELMQRNIGTIRAAWGSLTGRSCGCK